jgi:hypothetical protein
MAPDSPQPDLPVQPDGPNPDLQPPIDQAIPPDLAPTPDKPAIGCNAKYSSVPGYYLCEQTPTYCKFFYFVHPSKTSCKTQCEAHGGTCLGAKDNVATLECDEKPGSIACTDSYGDAICICSR